jgi:GR25 family glycosyltransferase involved in LPS biosynthesis
MHGYDVMPEQMRELQMLEEQQDFSTKAVFDYTYALENCYNTQAPWIIIFEDDVILGDGWLVKTLQALSDIRQQHGAVDHDWLFLRLFNQERSIGWASRIPGQNHEVLISLAIMTPIFLVLILLRARCPVCRRHLDNASIAIICFLAIPTFVVLFFQSGKASMLPPRPGVHKEGFGCCSQALVFPRIQIPRINEYFKMRRTGQIDLMLDELAVRDGLDRYALYPVQLQHIGATVATSL